MNFLASTTLKAGEIVAINLEFTTLISVRVSSAGIRRVFMVIGNSTKSQVYNSNNPNGYLGIVELEMVERVISRRL